MKINILLPAPNYHYPHLSVLVLVAFYPIFPQKVIIVQNKGAITAPTHPYFTQYLIMMVIIGRIYHIKLPLPYPQRPWVAFCDGPTI